MYFELPKLPEKITRGNDLELWLSLFKARTEEELASLEKMGAPEMTEAINVYRAITVTPEFREAARLREKASHDEAQALYTAEQKGRLAGEQAAKLNIARALLMAGDSLDKVMAITGLSRADLETLPH